MQRMTIRTIEDLTPSTELCTCAAGSRFRLSAVHHMNCAYSEACLKVHIAEQHQFYLEQEAKDSHSKARRVALYLRIASVSVTEHQGSLQHQEKTLLDAVRRRIDEEGETIVSIYKEVGRGRAWRHIRC